METSEKLQSQEPIYLRWGWNYCFIRELTQQRELEPTETQKIDQLNALFEYSEYRTVGEREKLAIEKKKNKIKKNKQTNRKKQDEH